MGEAIATIAGIPRIGRHWIVFRRERMAMDEDEDEDEDGDGGVSFERRREL